MIGGLKVIIIIQDKTNQSITLNSTCPFLEEQLKPKVYDLFNKPIQLVLTKNKQVQNNLAELKMLDLRPLNISPWSDEAASPNKSGSRACAESVTSVDVETNTNVEQTSGLKSGVNLRASARIRSKTNE